MTRPRPAAKTTSRAATKAPPRPVSKAVPPPALEDRAEDSTATDPSLGELVATATKDFSALVRQEVALAKAEITRDVVAAGKGAGLFSGAGVAGLLGTVFLSAALAYGIAGLFDISVGWGFLVVALLYLVGAGVLGMLGKKKISEVGPPEKTIETVKDDLEWAKHPTRTS